MNQDDKTFKPPLVLIKRHGTTGAHSFLKSLSSTTVFKVAEKEKTKRTMKDRAYKIK